MARAADFTPGDAVVYVHHDGHREDGVVTSVGPELVFVRYRGDDFSKATYPRDLEKFHP